MLRKKHAFLYRKVYPLDIAFSTSPNLHLPPLYSILSTGAFSGWREIGFETISTVDSMTMLGRVGE